MRSTLKTLISSIIWIGSLLATPILGIPPSHRIRLQAHTLQIEIASTPEQRQKGLMHRMHLPEGTGMLFIYEKPKILSFWMKDTFVPLSIGFFDENRCLINIAHMFPSSTPECQIYQSEKPALYALEVPYGWFERNCIARKTCFEFLE